MTKVYIIAGGPGDSELITVKGRRIINQADIIFTSFRFFNEDMFASAREDCQFYEALGSSYDERIEIVKQAVAENKTIAFVCMGDPCLYGMTQGLADRLDRNKIEFEIIPGVSAFNAACAILKKQMTGIGLPNTAICTSYRDKSGVEEYLEQIAALQASVALFMSVENLDSICNIFLEHYPEDTGVVVISKASQIGEKIAKGNLKNIKERTLEQGIEDGLILIGSFLDKPYDYELERQFMQRKSKEKQMRKA